MLEQFTDNDHETAFNCIDEDNNNGTVQESGRTKSMNHIMNARKTPIKQMDTPNQQSSLAEYKVQNQDGSSILVRKDDDQNNLLESN